jgi:uncharacterized protein (TIGR04222 family)
VSAFFELPGPAFLGAYGALVLVTLGLMILARRLGEGGPVPRLDLVDPGLLAALRGGSDEATRVTMVSLIDRGLLVAEPGGDARKVVAAPGAEKMARRGLELAILRRANVPVVPLSVGWGPEVAAAARAHEAELERLGLLPSPAQRTRRTLILAAALAVVVGAALIKVDMAVDRGHPFAFLVVAAVLGVILLVKRARPRRTVRGDRFMRDLETLFDGLKRRAAQVRPGGATAEAVMLAAVFGIAALPSQGFGAIHGLFPQPVRQGSGDGGGSSGGGSSCGGGGGCGGCGGCGS